MNAKKYFPFVAGLIITALLAAACASAKTVVETVEVMIEGQPMVVEVTSANLAEAVGDQAGGIAHPPIFPTPMPTQDMPRDMFFDDYGVNPFIDTEDDFLSTFALDVDTGSYTIARSYLNNGNLPPEDAIRTEEFINYFYQGYPNPSRREVFSINLDGAPSPFTETERYEMIRIGIQGYSIPPHLRKDVSLTFVIDVSGSMGQGQRLEMVKHALELLVEQLRSSDTVGIVAYSNNAWVVLEPTSGANQESILRAIYKLQPTNSTNAEAGLRLGYEMALEHFNLEGVNRVILCSDGVANVGATGPDSIWESIQYMAGEGITLTAVGVGMGNYNDVLLEQLADNGNGFYTYIDTYKEAENLFVNNLMSAIQAIALDAKVQIEFNPEVVSRYRLLGYENRAIADDDFRNDQVDAGEIGAGHSATALYEIKLNHGASGLIAVAHLRWEDPDTHEVYEMTEKFYTRQIADSFEEADPYFQMCVMVAEFAEILRDSYWAQDSTLSDLLYRAERMAEFFVETPEVQEFISLVRQAWSLTGSR